MVWSFLHLIFSQLFVISDPPIPLNLLPLNSIPYILFIYSRLLCITLYYILYIVFGLYLSLFLSTYISFTYIIASISSFLKISEKFHTLSLIFSIYENTLILLFIFLFLILSALITPLLY